MSLKLNKNMSCYSVLIVVTRVCQFIISVWTFMDLCNPAPVSREDRAHRERACLQLMNMVQSESNTHMNLTRELSGILNRVLHIENSILQRIILVRRMEQQVEDNIYVNKGDSELEVRNPSPPLPPPLALIKLLT